MDKFFKHFGINLKKNSSDHDSSGSTSIPQELNESTLALSKDKYCGWSALIDFPHKYSSRRNSEIAHRLASHDMDCNKFLNAIPDFKHHHQQYREHIYLNSTQPKLPRTRASICFDSTTPKLLDFYSDPADLKVEPSEVQEVEVVNKMEDVFSEDEDYTVPYQPNSLQKCRSFGSEEKLQSQHQENLRFNKNDSGKLTSTSNLCLSKYKIRKCSDITYDEPWDLNHTKRNLVGKLEATFSSNPALRPINTDETGQTKKVESPHEVQKRKLVRANDGNIAGRERCASSRASHENVPNQIPVQISVSPVGIGMCHCRHPSHRLTWQGAEQMTSSIISKNSPGSEGLFPDRHKVKTPPVPSPRQQIKISSDALENQRWYHGELGRLEAENLLKEKRSGSFLVRTSESNKKDFSLSLMSDGGLLHIKIVKENNQYILGQFSQPFESIPSIIKFFTINKLPVRGTHHILLTHPVDRELR